MTPTSTMLPAPYSSWLEEILGEPLPSERRARCDACSMTIEHGGVESDRAFAPDLKCCTYHPELPNFRVGAILADASAATARARAWLEERIRGGVAMTPLGLFRSASEQALHQRTNHPGAYGRTSEAVCPHYEPRDGTCGIWAYRETVCATFFCRFERGALGSGFWAGVRLLLGTAERVIATRVMLDLVPGGDACELLLRIGVEQRRDRANLDHLGERERRALWGAWTGREFEFFREAARRVAAMSWTDVLEIDRAELELLVRVVQRRHARLGLDLPATVRRGAGASVSRSSIPEHGRVTCASLPYDAIDVPIEALRRADRVASGATIEPADRDLVRSLLDYGYLEPAG